VKRRIISVSMMPGQMALMRMFEAASSSAADLVSPMRPCLVAALRGLALEALHARAGRNRPRRRGQGDDVDDVLTTGVLGDDLLVRPGGAPSRRNMLCLL
jgi:hypothetical protein